MKEGGLAASRFMAASGLSASHLCHCPHFLDQLLSSRFVGPTILLYQPKVRAGSEKTFINRFVPERILLLRIETVDTRIILGRKRHADLENPLVIPCASSPEACREGPYSEPGEDEGE